MSDADAPSVVEVYLTRAQQLYQTYLDQTVPHFRYRWAATGGSIFLFVVRILWVQGWYIGTWSS